MVHTNFLICKKRLNKLSLMISTENLKWNWLAYVGRRFLKGKRFVVLRKDAILLKSKAQIMGSFAINLTGRH